MKRIGLFFGSFNPITYGHLIVANSVLEENLVDEVRLVISPENPDKVGSKDFVDEKIRYNMAIAAIIKSNAKICVSSIEFDLPKPSYTHLTLQKFREMYPPSEGFEIFIVCGKDVYHRIPTWYASEFVMDNFSFILHDRAGYEEKNNDDIPEVMRNKTKVVQDSLIFNISSTDLRNRVKEGKSIEFLTPDSVIRIIKEKNLYL